jgi:hypothetical protein
VVANLSKPYKDDFSNYLDYRGIEERLEILERKYNKLNREKDQILMKRKEKS